MTDARRAGTNWTTSLARRCRRTRTLLVALPLLLLSVMADHGLATTGEPAQTARLDRASDAAGTEDKAQLPAHLIALADPLRSKAAGAPGGSPKALPVADAGVAEPSATGETGSPAAESSRPNLQPTPRSRAPPAAA